MWPLFCLMRPVAAVVFALDGILIGAGDTRYLAAAMVVALVVFAAARARGRTRSSCVWVALDVLMAVRLVTLAARFAGGRWALVGATPSGHRSSGSGSGKPRARSRPRSPR